MNTTLHNQNKYGIISISITVLLAILVITVEFVLAKYFEENYANVMFIILAILAYTNRKFIGRFLAIVVIDLLYLTYLKLDLSEISRIAGFHLSNLDMAFMIIFVLWFVQIYNKNLPGIQNENSRKLTSLFIVIAFVFIVAIIVGSENNVGIKPLFREGKILMVYSAYFPLRSMLRKKDLYHLFSVVMIVMFFATAYTFYLYLTRGAYGGIDWDYSLSTRVAASKFGGPFDLLLLPLASWAFIIALNSRKYRHLFLFLTFFFISGVFLAVSRAYTFGHVIPIIVIALMHFKLSGTSRKISLQRRTVISAIIICVITVLVLFNIRGNKTFIVVIDRLGSLVGTQYGATDFNISNMESRIYAATFGFKSALETPFGNGFGSYVLDDTSYYVPLGELLYHSLPLYLFYTFGLIGGSILIIALISILIIAFKQFRRNDGTNSIIAGVVFSYILSQLIIGGGGNTLFRPDTLFAIACAALISYPEKRSNQTV